MRGSSRPRPSLALVAALAASVLCSCDGHPALLSAAPSFRGELRISIRDGEQSVRELAGALDFDRATGRLRFERDVDGARVVLDRAPGSALHKTIDGAPAAVGFADEGDFALLMMVLTSEPDVEDNVRAIEGGYVIEHGTQRIEVVTVPAAGR